MLTASPPLLLSRPQFPQPLPALLLSLQGRGKHSARASSGSTCFPDSRSPSVIPMPLSRLFLLRARGLSFGGANASRKTTNSLPRHPSLSLQPQKHPIRSNRPITTDLQKGNRFRRFPVSRPGRRYSAGGVRDQRYRCPGARTETRRARGKPCTLKLWYVFIREIKREAHIYYRPFPRDAFLVGVTVFGSSQEHRCSNFEICGGEAVRHLLPKPEGKLSLE